MKPRLVKTRFNRFALRPVTWVRFRGRERSGIPSAYRSKYCSTRLCREILSLLKVSKNRQIITKYNIFWIKIFKTEGFSTLWKNSGKTIEKTLFLKIPCNTKKNHFDQNFQRWVPVEKGEKRLIIYQLFWGCSIRCLGPVFPSCWKMQLQKSWKLLIHKNKL